MKVLAVTTWYPTSAAPGTGVFVQRDCGALALDHEVTVVHLAPARALGEGPAETVDGPLRVIRVPLDWRRPDQLVRAAARLAGMYADYDLVHSMAFSAMIPMALRRPRVPWVHTEHWSALGQPSSAPAPLRVALPQLTRLLALPDVVVCVSSFLRDVVAARRRRPTMVVPNIVELEAEASPRHPRGPVLRLVAVGGLIERKDPETAVRTVAELHRRGVPAELVWVGAGPLLDRVEQLSAELGVADCVRFVGAVPPQAVAEHLSRADIFLLPTRSETFCVAAAEALAAGRPVVVGAHGGQVEFVDESVGELVAEQTPQTYADAVVRVDERHGRTPAEHFSDHVRHRFSVDNTRSAYREVYAQAMGVRRA